MTPAQEAKEFAAAHGFAIGPRGRRYYIGYIALDGNEIEIAEVGGYPAALNAMKRWVDEHKSEVVNASLTDAAGRYVVARVERGELEKAREAGADVKVVPGWDKTDTSVEEPALDHVAIVDTPPNQGCVVGDMIRPRGLSDSLRAPDRGPMATVPGPKWRVWQRNVEGFWRPLILFTNRAEAVKYCRQLANITSLRKLARKIVYEV